MRGDPYGSHRVIEPKGLLPQAAEKVDNTPVICSNERVPCSGVVPLFTVVPVIGRESNGSGSE